jgi:hypothetical protein
MRASIWSRTWRGEVKLAPAKAVVERMENQTSTWLSHEACVGVKMKPDVLVAGEPAIAFRLVSVEIVQDHVNLAARMLGDDAVHEVQELDAPAAAVVAGFDQAGGPRARRTGLWCRGACTHG